MIDHMECPRSTLDEAASAHIDDLVALAKLPNVAVKATGGPRYSSERAVTVAATSTNT